VEKLFQYSLYGIVLGSAYAIAASGLVVTYATSGIFNFAQGAVGMLAAFAYWQLRVDWGWPAPIALIVVLLVLAPLFGAFLQRVIMAGIQNTSEIVRIVVPVAVMLFAIALANWIWNPNVTRSLRAFFGNTNTVDIGGVALTYHEIFAFFVAVAIAVGLRLFLYRTRTGVSMRAVVDDQPLLQLNGGRPDRASMLSWAIGCALAAVAGILITPMQGGSLSSTLLTLLVINAYAAAMFGRLRNLPLTFVGALVLGLANSYVNAYFPSNWTWRTNFRTSIPMILLFVVLLVLPQDRLRGAVVTRTRERFRVPTMQSAVTWGAVLILTVFLLSRLMEPGAVNLLSYGMALAIVALSLVLLTGYAGEVNLGVLAFAGIAAIVLFHVGTTGGLNANVPILGPDARSHWYGYFIAAAVAAVVGALVALPALRLRGLYLGLATLAFGVFVSNMIFKEGRPRRLFGWDFTIFPNGTLNMPRLKIGPLDFKPQRPFLMLVTVVFTLFAIGLIALRRSSYGRKLAAMKDSPAACATLGLNTVGLKLSVFALSAAIAGFGGALLATQIGAVTPDRFEVFGSLSLFMLTVVGGIGYVSGGLMGGILAGVAFVAMQDTLRKLGVDYPSFEGMFKWLASFTTILPATIAISLGRNPSGAVSDIVDGYEPLRRARSAVIALVALLLGAWLLAQQDLISNWWFVVLVAVIMIGVPRIAQALRPGAFMAPDEYEARKGQVPLELVGVDRPFTPADARMLDSALELDGAAARRASASGQALTMAAASNGRNTRGMSGPAPEPEVVK
jgi:branched-subunit amino acid ABC-type transport system permease component